MLTATEMQQTLDKLMLALNNDEIAAPAIAWPDPKYLALQGGGAKGVCYLGALEALAERGIFDNIEAVCGSSVGAITALQIALGMSPQQIKAYAASINLLDLWDARDGVFGKAVAGHMVGIATGALSGGAFSGENALAWAQRILLLATGKHNITFAELAELRKSRPEMKDFICIATRQLPIPGTETNIQIFSAIDTPDVLVADAMVASMSFPGAWQARMVHRKAKDGTLVELGYHYDGGVENNFPIDYFDQAKYVNPTYPLAQCVGRTYNFNPLALGMMLCSIGKCDPTITPHTDNVKQVVSAKIKPVTVKVNSKPSQHTVGGAGTLVTIIARNKVGAVKLDENPRHKALDHADTTIQLYNHEVGAMDLGISAAKKAEMIAWSKETVQQWFAAKRNCKQEYPAEYRGIQLPLCGTVAELEELCGQYIQEELRAENANIIKLAQLVWRIKNTALAIDPATIKLLVTDACTVANARLQARSMEIQTNRDQLFTELTAETAIVQRLSQYLVMSPFVAAEFTCLFRGLLSRNINLLSENTWWLAEAVARNPKALDIMLTEVRANIHMVEQHQAIERCFGLTPTAIKLSFEQVVNKLDYPHHSGNGTTLLRLAVDAGNVDSVKVLMRNHCDPKVPICANGVGGNIFDYIFELRNDNDVQGVTHKETLLLEIIRGRVAMQPLHAKIMGMLSHSDTFAMDGRLLANGDTLLHRLFTMDESGNIQHINLLMNLLVDQNEDIFWQLWNARTNLKGEAPLDLALRVLAKYFPAINPQLSASGDRFEPPMSNYIELARMVHHRFLAADNLWINNSVLAKINALTPEGLQREIASSAAKLAAYAEITVAQAPNMVALQDGCSILHYLCRHAHSAKPIIDFLVRERGEPYWLLLSQADQQGITPLHYLIDNDHYAEILTTLRNWRSLTQKTVLTEWSLDQYFPCVKPVTGEDATSFTPLEYLYYRRGESAVLAFAEQCVPVTADGLKSVVPQWVTNSVKAICPSVSGFKAEILANLGAIKIKVERILEERRAQELAALAGVQALVVGAKLAEEPQLPDLADIDQAEQLAEVPVISPEDIPNFDIASPTGTPPIPLVFMSISQMRLSRGASYVSEQQESTVDVAEDRSKVQSPRI